MTTPYLERMLTPGSPVSSQLVFGVVRVAQRLVDYCPTDGESFTNHAKAQKEKDEGLRTSMPGDLIKDVSKSCLGK